MTELSPLFRTGTLGELSAAERERIAAELRALGEDGFVDGEIDEGATAEVTALIGSVHAPAIDPPLSDIEQRRAWKKLAARVPGLQHVAVSPPRLRLAAIGFAAAAMLALVPALGQRLGQHAHDPSAHARATALGADARRALEALPGQTDGARAQALAEAYAAQLQAQPEGQPQ